VAARAAAEIGRDAAHMLLTLLRGESSPPNQVDMDFEVVVRQSA
jgi:DNA-binding LacI/PurR family transcriptional regulator